MKPRTTRQPGTPALESLEDRLAPAVYTVLNLNDSGAGSLRTSCTYAARSRGHPATSNTSRISGCARYSSPAPRSASNWRC